MSSRVPRTARPSAARRADVDLIAERLLPRASLLTRLLVRRAASDLSRAEAGVLGAVRERPLRITELAASQALAQPTVTQIVGRLEERGFAVRERHAGDGRVVVVSPTPAGTAALEALRRENHAMLRELLADRSDAEVRALAGATELLEEIIEALLREDAP